MGLLNQRSGVKMKSSRTQVFSLSILRDILSLTAFTFRFVPVVVKWLRHLHVSCLHMNTPREQFWIVHVSLTGGNIFLWNFYYQNSFSLKSLAGIGSHAHILSPREAGMQIYFHSSWWEAGSVSIKGSC